MSRRVRSPLPLAIATLVVPFSTIVSALAGGGGCSYDWDVGAETADGGRTPGTTAPPTSTAMPAPPDAGKADTGTGTGTGTGTPTGSTKDGECGPSCVCKGTDSCNFKCTTGNCKMACSDASRCEIDCPKGTVCDIDCRENASCNFDCTEGASCALTCAAGARCVGECTGIFAVCSRQCARKCEVSCRDGALCTNG